ncbi:MAG: hypothetical protein KTR25_18480 [Myxococcales bacterium]|nr:hypothetical protein [Myxococcales bacterium]
MVLLAQEVELEREALKRLRAGDLQGAHDALTDLELRRPQDSRLRQRIEQIEQLLARQIEVHTKMLQEPLRYAHAYIKSGRLKDGLKFLKMAAAKYPSNGRIQQLAQQIEAKLHQQNEPLTAARSAKPAVSPSVEDLLKELLQLVRIRRRAPSRWIMDTAI